MAALDATEADCAIIFGSAHLATIDASLAEREFAVEGWEWLTVERLPSWGYCIAVSLIGMHRTIATRLSRRAGSAR